MRIALIVVITRRKEEFNSVIIKFDNAVDLIKMKAPHDMNRQGKSDFTTL